MSRKTNAPKTKKSDAGNGGKPYSDDARHAKRVRNTILSLFIVGVLCLGIGGYIYLSHSVEQFISAPEVHEPDEGLLPENPDIHATTGPSGGSVFRREGVYTVILAGTDLDDYHTDTLMVATLDTVNHKLDVLSIPRDTQVDVKWSIKKINAAWGANNQDISLLRDLISQTIGFKPDCYVIVDLKGFVDLIDAVEGIDYNVPRRMKYSDRRQNLYIDLQPGMQHLDGEKAIQLVRYRYGYREGDPARIALQQDFLTEAFKQVIEKGNAFDIPEFINIAAESVRTDLTAGHMIWFMQEIMKLEKDSITFHTLPGNPSAYYKEQNYYVVDSAETVKLINDHINPYTFPITEDKLHVIRLVDYYK